MRSEADASYVMRSEADTSYVMRTVGAVLATEVSEKCFTSSRLHPPPIVAR